MAQMHLLEKYTVLYILLVEVSINLNFARVSVVSHLVLNISDFCLILDRVICREGVIIRFLPSEGKLSMPAGKGLCLSSLKSRN